MNKVIKSDLIAKLIADCSMLAILAGLSFEEGQIMFTAGALAMEMVSKHPEEADIILGEFVQQALKQGKGN